MWIAGMGLEVLMGGNGRKDGMILTYHRVLLLPQAVMPLMEGPFLDDNCKNT